MRHTLILLGILVGVTLLRINVNESRVIDLVGNPSWPIIRMILGVGVGPLISSGLTFLRPITTMLNLSAAVGALTLAVLAMSLWLLWREPMAQTASSGGASPGNLWPWLKTRVPQPYLQALQVGIVGLVLTCLSYGLSLNNFPLYLWAGRATSIHVAGTFGISLVGASLASMLLFGAEKHQRRLYAVVGLAVYFSLLAGFHVIIQKDFKDNWNYQKQFWTKIMKLCPDVTDGTVIFVEDDGGLRKDKYIFAHSWADYAILNCLFEYPENWSAPPELLVMGKDWQGKVVRQGDEVKCQIQRDYLTWATLPPGNLILLKATPDGLVRWSGPLALAGREFPLKQPHGHDNPAYNRTKIFDLLIEVPGKP